MKGPEYDAKLAEHQRKQAEAESRLNNTMNNLGQPTTVPKYLAPWRNRKERRRLAAERRKR